MTTVGIEFEKVIFKSSKYWTSKQICIKKVYPRNENSFSVKSLNCYEDTTLYNRKKKWKELSWVLFSQQQIKYHALARLDTSLTEMQKTEWYNHIWHNSTIFFVILFPGMNHENMKWMHHWEVVANLFIYDLFLASSNFLWAWANNIPLCHIETKRHLESFTPRLLSYDSMR